MLEITNQRRLLAQNNVKYNLKLIQKVPVCSVKILRAAFLCFCALGVIENKFSFVFHCPMYSVLRSCYLKKIEFKNPDLFWLSKDNTLKRLSLFW